MSSLFSVNPYSLSTSLFRRKNYPHLAHQTPNPSPSIPTMPSRNCFCISISVIAIIAIALGVGLTYGLKHKPTSSSSKSPSSPDSTSQFTGDLNYYAPGLGACGKYSTATDAICAISHARYDAAANGPNPNTNPLCGRRIRASRNGRSVVVTVVDRCEGCGEDDVDFSPGAFQQLASLQEGRVRVGWSWV